MSDPGIRILLQQEHPIPLTAQLECRAGELLALVGPSGSGKTTILRTIAGLHQVRNGLIECQGEIWQNSASSLFLPAHRRHVGLVFQHYALFPHMTVPDNIQRLCLICRSHNEKFKLLNC